MSGMLKRKGGHIVALILCASLLSGLFGCGQKPDGGTDEPVDGGGTYRRDDSAPKVIESKDITDFYASFFIGTRWTGDEDHQFHFSVKPDETGALTAREELSGVSSAADSELLSRLQAVIDKYDLASKNGIYESNMSLPPEFQDCEMLVDYASGEQLKFKILNEPYALWGEEVYDTFADWFGEKGNQSLWPPEDGTKVTRLRLWYMENGVMLEYGGIKVQPENAVNGETFLLHRNDEFILFPEDYYGRVTEILSGYPICRKYDFSRFDHAENNFGNHDKGYFGWGDEPEGEEDSEDSMVSLHIEYESGRSISIDTRKPSEIEGLMPLIEELIRYHDTLF